MKGKKLGEYEAVRLIDQRGAVRWSDLVRAGATRNTLDTSWELSRGGKLRVARGVLVSERIRNPYDQRLLAVALRSRSAVFSLTTALWIHGALEDEPELVWIAIGPKARKPMLEDLAAIRFEPRADTDGVVRKPLRGVSIAAQSPALSAVLCLKYRHRIGDETAACAVRAVRTSQLATDDALRVGAEQLGVTSLLQPMIGEPPGSIEEFRERRRNALYCRLCGTHAQHQPRATHSFVQEAFTEAQPVLPRALLSPDP